VRIAFSAVRNSKNDAVPAYEPWNVERAKALIGEHVGLKGPLIPILHALNDRFGHINNEAIKVVADVLNLTRAEVQGVVGFYHDFRREPAGRHVIQVCRAEACQSMGCEELAERLERSLGVKFGETTPDRRVTLLAVYCLGNCALSPSVMVDGELHGRMDEAKVLELVRTP
jgi:formate dehydrogenase subunit gamma